MPNHQHSSMQPDAEYIFLGQLSFQLKRSTLAYNEYLNAGKTYMHARILRVCNEGLRQLIMQNGYLLTDQLQKEAMAIVGHYDVWMQKWDFLQHNLQPNPDDEFVFENDVRFPKSSASELETRFQELRKHYTKSSNL